MSSNNFTISNIFVNNLIKKFTECVIRAVEIRRSGIFVIKCPSEVQENLSTYSNLFKLYPGHSRVYSGVNHRQPSDWTKASQGAAITIEYNKRHDNRATGLLRAAFIFQQEAKMKTEFFRFRLTPQHLGKIKSIAEVFGTTEANVLRNLIEHAEVKSLPVVSASLELPAKNSKSALQVDGQGAFAN